MVSRVLKDQWQKSSLSGLYVPKRNFPLRGLVLYADLWNPEKQGDTFNCLDFANESVHIATVTGAVWGYQGRVYDGDDKITAANSITDYPFTLGAWVNFSEVTADSEYCIIAIGDTSVANKYFAIWKNGTTNKISIGGASGGGQQRADSTITPVVGTWYRVDGVFIASGNADLYVNGVLDGHLSGGLAFTACDSLSIGRLSLDADYWPLKGTVGEGEAYKLAVSAAEIQNIYLTTRWRYQ